MIATPATAPKNEFEKLLDQAVTTLNSTIAIAPAMSNFDFEDAVFKSMIKVSKGTPFDGTIKKTEEREFPDIVAQDYYGVEVKKTTKEGFRTSGNSIFETSRCLGVEQIYIVMASKNKVRWKPYDEAIHNIVVTHSPRYAIDFDFKKNVFEEMGVTYDNFRMLNQSEKMDKIKSLYADRTLWWLSKSEGITYKFWSDTSSCEKESLRAEIMFICPEVFSSNTLKFKGATVYVLGKGIIIPNIRDVFSAGGKTTIRSKQYPHICKHLNRLLPEIKRLAADRIDIETLENFWEIPPHRKFYKRFEQWKLLVRKNCDSNVDIEKFLDDFF